MRVALLTSHYPPLRTSAAVQMHHLAREFVDQGHETIVIVPDIEATSSCSIVVIEGVKVLRIFSLNFLIKNHFYRTLFELSLPFMVMFGIMKSPYRNAKWDLIVWYSPTIFWGPLVLYIKIKSRCKTYLILRDIFPEWALDLGVLSKGFSYYFFKCCANFQYLMADTIGVQSSSNLGFFNRWNKFSNKRLEVLENWQTPSINIGCSISIDKTKLADRKIFIYIGNMGVAQGMDFLIDLAFELRDRHDLGFIFIGRGSEVDRLKLRVAELSLMNILFFEEINSDQMPGLLSQCHVGLLALDPRHKSHNIPGKLLTYLAANIPVLARVNAGNDLVSLIDGEGIGLTYVGESVSTFKVLAEKIMDDPVQYQKMVFQGAKLVKERFTTAKAVKQIIQSIK